jgi:hypothetical protein
LQKYLPAETRAHVKKFIGTHYYYEGKGSIATLTKDEVAAYRETMISFVTKQNNMLEEKSLSKTSVPVTNGDGGGEEDKSSVVNAAIVLKPQEEE